MRNDDPGRQAWAEAKATRLEAWATKRREVAAQLLAQNAPYDGDIAFATQPGYFPLRKRVLARHDRARSLQTEAQEFERRADALRHLPVRGDTEAARQARRNLAISWVQVGQRARSLVYGTGTVEKINRKTVLLKLDSGPYRVLVDVSHISKEDQG